MFLYELALQLGVRSTDLVERARSLGMDVGPSSFLTPEQMIAVRDGVPPPGVAPAPVAAVPPAAPGDPHQPVHHQGVPHQPTPVAVGGPEPMAGVPAGAQLPPVAFGPGPSTASSPFADPLGSPFGPGAPAPGVPGGPPAPKRSVGIVVAIVAIVALAAGACVYLFQQTKDDDEVADSTPAALATDGEAGDDKSGDERDGEDGGSGQTGSSAGALDLGEAEITDPEEFCQINRDFDVALEELQLGDGSTFASTRSAILRSTPTALEHLDRLGEVTTGELQAQVDSMMALTVEAQRLFESLPTSEYEITSSQLAEMRDLQARLDGVGDRLEAAFERCS